eukprot:TRINITY_DN1986_c2_g1_i1.p1 TRINITY_DN1986_c2_g1~~TRINITY_DN1986_c2_g1_i1.p1  ORF type:complete len:306 (-),score=79.83 TRINITY_DN1986_c2_g1_i1:112-945(-)
MAWHPSGALSARGPKNGGGPGSNGGSVMLPELEAAAAAGSALSAGCRARARLRHRSRGTAAEVRAGRVEKRAAQRTGGRRAGDAAARPGSSVRAATAAEIKQVAVMLNRRMVDVVADPAARGWYKMFNHLDDDGSGKISYAELEDLIRNELRLTASAFPEDQLQAIWRALDRDNSGLITCGEFGHFWRIGEAAMSAADGEKKGPQRLLEVKKALGDRGRQERRECKAALGERLKAELDARRLQASSIHSADWGLNEGLGHGGSSMWRSPRAHIFDGR